MTKKLTIAGLSLAAIASSAFVLGAEPARAACLSSSISTNCSTFEGGSSSDAEYFAYIDPDLAAGEKITALSIDLGGGLNVPGLFPITFTNIAYSWDNGASYVTTGLTSTSYTFNMFSTTSGNLLTGEQAKPGGGTIGSGTLRFKFTIPAGAFPTTGPLRAITSSLSTAKLDDTLPQTQTRSSTPVAGATGTPSPLPIIGAGAAFGFSRRLRKQIKQVA